MIHIDGRVSPGLRLQSTKRLDGYLLTQSSHRPRGPFLVSILEVHALESIMGISLERTEGFQGSIYFDLPYRSSLIDNRLAFGSRRSLFSNSVLGGGRKGDRGRSLRTRLLLLSAFHCNREGTVCTLRGILIFEEGSC